MEWFNKKIFVIALFLSLFTSLIIYSYINRLGNTTKPVEMVEVYVASKTIPPRAVITPIDIKQVAIDKKYVLSSAVKNKAEIIGKRVKESILAGEQIVRDRLIDENKAGLSYSIPSGKRAVSVNVNEASQVAGFISPGDYVDVVATFEKEEMDEQGQKVVYPKISKIILQNVLVLGVGQDNHLREDEKKKELPKTVTLAVDSQDVEKLVFASEVGILRLALRPMGDSKVIDTNGITRTNIMSTKP